MGSRRLLVACALATAGVQQALAAGAMRVAVTGAGGQTGGHVFRKMLRRSDIFEPIGIARTEASKEALVAATGCDPEQVVVVDVSSSDKESSCAGLAAAFAGCVALVIGTSAKVKPTGGTNPETGRPNMGFPDGQPYAVDWLGQKRQIDAGKAAGVKHVALCSSMGGTDPNHMLNRFGRNEDGTGGGILLWKRKAEKYLMESGLTYTIVHPGGLVNEPGGARELIVGVDDRPSVSTESRTVPRDDVAEVLLQSLLHDDFRNRSFDLIAEADSGVPPATDFESLLSPLDGASCDYSLGAIPGQEAEEAELRALTCTSKL